MVRVGRGSRAQAKSGGCSDAIPAGPRARALVTYLLVSFLVIFSSVPAGPLALVPLCFLLYSHSSLVSHPPSFLTYRNHFFFSAISHDSS